MYAVAKNKRSVSWGHKRKRSDGWRNCNNQLFCTNHSYIYYHLYKHAYCETNHIRLLLSPLGINGFTRLLTSSPSNNICPLNEYYHTVVIANEKLSNSEAKSRCYDNFEGDNNRVVIFLINTCCDHFKIDHILIGFSFWFFVDNYNFKGNWYFFGSVLCFAPLLLHTDTHRHTDAHTHTHTTHHTHNTHHTSFLGFYFFSPRFI